MAASVTSAPVASKATSTSRRIGRGLPVSRSKREPGPPIPVGLPGTSARRTPSIHQHSGESEAECLERVGQDAQREHRPRHEEERARDGLRVVPRVLVGLDADRGHEDADRHDRGEAERPSRR